MSSAKANNDSVKQIHYLAAALQAPRLTEAAARSPDRPRDTDWPPQHSAAAVLDRARAARTPPATAGAARRANVSRNGGNEASGAGSRRARMRLRVNCSSALLRSVTKAMPSSCSPVRNAAPGTSSSGRW